MDSFYTCGQFNISYPPIMDGIAQTVIHYSQGLTDRGVTCYTVVPKAGNWQEYDRNNPVSGIIRASSIPRPFARPYVWPCFDLRLRRILAKLPLDIIHTHYPVRMETYASALAKERGIPQVASFHTAYREQILHDMPIPWFARRKIHRFTNSYNRATEIWVPTPGAKSMLLDYGYTRDNIAIMPNGTSYTPMDLQNQEEARKKGRELLGIGGANEIPVLLYVGNLLKTKNLDRIMDSLEMLCQLKKDFLMIFAGNGYYRPTLEQRARDAGIGSRVRFLGTVTDRVILSKLYSCAHLLLFPSVADTDGVVRMEAAAHNLAMLAMKRAPGSHEIHDGVNGFLCEDSSVDYGKKLLYCLTHPQLSKAGGVQAARTLYRGWDDVISLVDSRYRELIRENRNKVYSVRGYIQEG